MTSRRSRRAPADQVGERVGGDGNADRVRQRLGAGDVGADEVALHHVIRPAGVAPRMATPLSPLAEMRLPAPATEPPMVLFEALSVKSDGK